MNQGTSMQYGLTRQRLTRSFFAAAMTITMASWLTGCAAPKRMYEWGDYQAKVYEHFKGTGSPEQQILDLQGDLELMKAEGKTAPPGYYGHMGLLYLTVGKNDLAAQSWLQEKSIYPESAKYMDFLLNNMKKQGS